MSKLKRCFAALGFTETPATEQEVEARYGALLAEHKGSTETDRLARQLLQENRDMCLAAMRGE